MQGKTTSIRCQLQSKPESWKEYSYISIYILMNKQNFWNWHNTFKKIPQQNLGGQLLKVDKKNIVCYESR